MILRTHFSDLFQLKFTHISVFWHRSRWIVTSTQFWQSCFLELHKSGLRKWHLRKWDLRKQLL